MGIFENLNWKKPKPSTHITFHADIPEETIEDVWGVSQKVKRDEAKVKKIQDVLNQTDQTPYWLNGGDTNTITPGAAAALKERIGRMHNLTKPIPRKEVDTSFFIERILAVPIVASAAILYDDAPEELSIQVKLEDSLSQQGFEYRRKGREALDELLKTLKPKGYGEVTVSILSKEVIL